MIKIRTFKLGKKKQYHGFVISFLIFKFERIGMGNKFLWRFELSNWSKDE